MISCLSDEGLQSGWLVFSLITVYATFNRWTNCKLPGGTTTCSSGLRFITSVSRTTHPSFYTFPDTNGTFNRVHTDMNATADHLCHGRSRLSVVALQACLDHRRILRHRIRGFCSLACGPGQGVHFIILASKGPIQSRPTQRVVSRQGTWRLFRRPQPAYTASIFAWSLRAGWQVRSRCVYGMRSPWIRSLARYDLSVRL